MCEREERCTVTYFDGSLHHMCAITRETDNLQTTPCKGRGGVTTGLTEVADHRAFANLRRETRTNFLYAATMMALIATLGVDRHWRRDRHQNDHGNDGGGSGNDGGGSGSDGGGSRSDGGGSRVMVEGVGVMMKGAGVMATEQQASRFKIVQLWIVYVYV